MADTRRLPHPVTSEWTWQVHGLCRGMDSAVFFHPDGERGSARARRQASAKAVCATCPVLVRCRVHALKVHEPYGVWGALSEEERQAIIAKGDLAVHSSISQAEQLAATSGPAERSTTRPIVVGARATNPFGIAAVGNFAPARTPVAGS